MNHVNIIITTPVDATSVAFVTDVNGQFCGGEAAFTDAVTDAREPGGLQVPTRSQLKKHIDDLV